ncbi:putative polyketide synthase 16 [Holothuria leucospilota]|uniref:Polyketide synthase 16 n=1 Tax=Holothuria leucospilota TaxID=206669 RepID=A0A9Q1BJS8_HOLLE|nr:putative polyketide synthase 16 [Holothuria leucospilota]
MLPPNHCNNTISSFLHVEIAQPSICALQIALAEVYRQLVVLPHAVIGSSLGEVAAACVAGYLTFRDTMKLVYIRSISLDCMTGKGDMAIIFLQAFKVREKLLSPEYKGKVEFACVNSPCHTVIAGYVDELSSLVDYFESQGVRRVNLKVRNAFHSFQQEEIKETFLVKTNFLQSASQHEYKKYLHRLIPMISTVTGEFVSHEDLNSNQYWWKNIRQPVELERSLRRLYACGYNVFLEIGPHAYYSKAIRETLESASQTTDACYHAHC